MDKIRIERGTVQETLVIPLYGRKLCTGQFPDIFCDPKSVELLERIDYDFSAYESRSGAMRRFGALEFAVRQNDVSHEVRGYLNLHPGAAVVSLGCGPDQTGEACDNGECRMCNIDLRM